MGVVCVCVTDRVFVKSGSNFVRANETHSGVESNLQFSLVWLFIGRCGSKYMERRSGGGEA